MQPFLVHCVLTLGLITCSSAYAVDPLKESNGAARGNAVNDEEESAPRIEFLSGRPAKLPFLTTRSTTSSAGCEAGNRRHDGFTGRWEIR